MEGPVYPAAFARHGLDMRTPGPADRGLIDDIIFDELCQGVLSDTSRAEYVRITEELKSGGCDAVALSCTEIPLLLTPAVSPLPTLDSTRLLAREAVAAALDERKPHWRGGPVAD
jgi:aspartate racemase